MRECYKKRTLFQLLKSVRKAGKIEKESDMVPKNKKYNKNEKFSNVSKEETNGKSRNCNGK